MCRFLLGGTLSSEACQKVLGCTTTAFHRAITRLNDGGVRNGQMGQNANSSNIMAATFIACGQDVGGVLESDWSHLTTALNGDSLTLSLYFLRWLLVPSVVVHSTQHSEKH